MGRLIKAYAYDPSKKMLTNLKTNVSEINKTFNFQTSSLEWHYQYYEYVGVTHTTTSTSTSTYTK